MLFLVIQAFPMMTSEEAPMSASIDAVMTDPPTMTKTNNTKHEPPFAPEQHEQHEQKHAEALTLTQRTHNKEHDNDEKIDDWGETSLKSVDMDAATRCSPWGGTLWPAFLLPQTGNGKKKGESPSGGEQRIPPTSLDLGGIPNFKLVFTLIRVGGAWGVRALPSHFDKACFVPSKHACICILHSAFCILHSAFCILHRDASSLVAPHRFASSLRLFAS